VRSCILLVWFCLVYSQKVCIILAMHISGLLTSRLSVAIRPGAEAPGRSRQEGCGGRPDASSTGLIAMTITSSGGRGMRMGEGDIVTEQLRMVDARGKPADAFDVRSELVADSNQGIRPSTVWDSPRLAGGSA
jgi:hypothetical protein